VRRRAFLRAGGMSLGVAAGFGAVGYSAAMTVGAPHPPPRDDDAIPARLRPAQMRTDIDAFADTIVAVGTDPFLTCPRGVFDAARVHALDACTSEMSIREFWRVAATLAAALNDGHVSIQPTFYEKRSEFPLGILRSVARQRATRRRPRRVPAHRFAPEISYARDPASVPCSPNKR